MHSPSKYSFINMYLISGKSFPYWFTYISEFDNCPYRGEVSAKLIKDLGVDWIIIGHSERRKIFNQNEEKVRKKIEKAIDNKLNIILCIGDNKEEKENNKDFEVLNMELETLFTNIKDNSDYEKVIITMNLYGKMKWILL